MGAPFFNTVAVPVGLALLFLMAVAPVLSWRKINGSVLWQRLAIPVWVGVGTVVLCVAFGLRGVAPLVGFGLGAMAAATAARALVLSVRAAHARAMSGWWRGLVGRANGGMVVHLGVVVLAVGHHRRHLLPPPGRARPAPGHGRHLRRSPLRVRGPAHRDLAVAHVAGGPGQGRRRGVFTPATTSFGSALSAVGTPAIDSGFFGDVYLTFDAVGGLGADVGQSAHPQPAGGLGGHRRGDRAAGGLAVGRRPARRGRRPAGAGPGVTAPGHRSRPRRRRPTGDGRAARARTGERDAAPEPVGALVARGVRAPA